MSVSESVSKVLNMLLDPWKDDEYSDEYENDGDFTEGIKSELGAGEYIEDNRARALDFRPKNERKVVQLQRHEGGAKSNEVVVFEPKAYSESIQFAQALKERKTVILNLQLLDREESRRIVDFLCGCAHALDGSQRKIGDCVFIFTPHNINLTQETVSSKLTSDALWNVLPQNN